MYFEDNRRLAADRLDFARACQLLRKDKYVNDSRCEVPRLVEWVRSLVLLKGEKWVYESRDELVAQWMTEKRFHYGLSKNMKIRIIEQLRKEGRRAAASEWNREALGEGK